MGCPEAPDWSAERKTYVRKIQRYHNGLPRQLTRRRWGQGSSYRHLVPHSHLAFVTIQKLTLSRILERQQCNRGTSKKKCPWKTCRFLLSVNEQGRRSRIDDKTKDERPKAVINYTTRHTSTSRTSTPPPPWYILASKHEKPTTSSSASK